MTPVIAAADTADRTAGQLILAAVVLLWIASYALACYVWPFARCKRCTGTGTRPSPSGKAFRVCRKCKGRGRRIRTGRRVFNWLHLLHKEGT